METLTYNKATKSFAKKLLIKDRIKDLFMNEFNYELTTPTDESRASGNLSGEGTIVVPFGYKGDAQNVKELLDEIVKELKKHDLSTDRDAQLLQSLSTYKDIVDQYRGVVFIDVHYKNLSQQRSSYRGTSIVPNYGIMMNTRIKYWSLKRPSESQALIINEINDMSYFTMDTRSVANKKIYYKSHLKLGIDGGRIISSKLVSPAQSNLSSGESSVVITSNIPQIKEFSIIKSDLVDTYFPEEAEYDMF